LEIRQEIITGEFSNESEMIGDSTSIFVASPSNGSPPNHLVILIHGLHGGSGDLQSFKNQLLKTPFSSSLLIHSARCNEGFFGTLDGIDAGGDRVTMEITKLIEENPNIKYLSVIGHSLGGLYGRYSIGSLHKQNFFDKVKPMNFITMASPHMGSRRSSKGLYNPLASWVTKNLFSRTGKQLMLEDLEGEEPLLMKMSQHGESWLEALKLFRQRTLYSNIQNDLQVPYCTSAIVHRNPYLSRVEKKLEFHDDYPHIVSRRVEIDLTNEDDIYQSDEKRKYLIEMLKNLQTLQWKRYDVLIDSVLCHEMIVHKRPWLRMSGNDVVEHVVSFFEHDHRECISV